MTERTVPQVECELCGEPFDPTVAGGWCTNDDCGEWQYETYADYAGGSPTSEGTTDAGGEPGDPESPETGAEDAAPPDDAPRTENVPDPVEEAEGGDTTETPVEKNADGPDVDLELCPECGADADPSHRFCTGCGTDLDEIRAEITEVTTCPDCGADVVEADRYCTSCGTDLQAAIVADDESGDEPPADLSLEAHGRSIVVEPDQTVGREVRSLLADAGRPDDEAVRIHREHVRFIRENGEFFVVDLGENPTAVNGATLEKGDRVAVEPGDELTLSEVVTLTIGTKDA